MPKKAAPTGSLFSQPDPTLPPGWQRVRFGDVARNVDINERSPKDRGLERYIGLEHIDPESLHIKRWGLISEGTSFTRLFQKGQVLFGKRRAYQRKVAVPDFDGLCSGDILVFEPQDSRLLPDLLPFLAQSEGFFRHALGTSAGSLSPRTRWKDLAEYTFPLPPIEEQRRIAEILWAAEEAKASLPAAMEALSRLSSALGYRLFQGNHSSMIRLGELMANGVLDVQTGPFGTVIQASSYVAEGTPIVNPINMVDGKLFTANGPFLSNEECERLASYKLSENDILLARRGEIGRSAYVTNEYSGYILGTGSLRLRLHGNSIQSNYLYYFMRSPQVCSWLESNALGTTMLSLNERIIAQLELAVPDLSTQQKIIDTFSQLDKVADNLRIKMDKNSALIKQLINNLLMPSPRTEERVCGGGLLKDT